MSVFALDPISVTASTLGLGNPAEYTIGYISDDNPTRNVDIAMLLASAAERYCETEEYVRETLLTWVQWAGAPDAVAAEVAKLADCDRQVSIHKNVFQMNMNMVEAMTMAVGVPPPATDFQFSGTNLAAFAGIYHYMYGNGADRQFALQDTGITPTLAKFDKFRDFVNSPNNPVGTTFVDMNTGYDTGEDSVRSFLVLGRISARVVGNLSVNDEGWYEFTGTFFPLPDIYDGGEMSPHRTALGNAFTQVLNILAPLGGTPYNISITGSMPIYFSGRRQ